MIRITAITALLGTALLTSACSMFSRPVEPAAAAPAAPPATPRVALAFATVKGTEQSAEGGTITRVAYAERSGDATSLALLASDDELVVKGQFLAAGRSAYGGVGVIVSSASGPIDASRYKMLRIRLGAAAGVNTLRVRLVGMDTAAQQSGCYPVVLQPVTVQSTTYEIALDRFVPEAYCGNRGVTAAKVLMGLDGIEVVDAVAPVRSRAVLFNLGAVSLLE